jgi:hypothetical protein
MLIFVAIIGVFGTTVLATLVRGFVLSILWGWFIVPLGVNPIGMAWAIGISGITTLLTYQFDTKREDAKWGKGMVFAFIMPLITLGVCWIAHSFM